MFQDTENTNIIELKNMGQSYDGGQNWIIKDFNMLIENKPNQGQFICILGVSGCGKSTILRYIAGLQKPTEGEVYLNGKLRTEQDRIGMVFQKYSSLPWMTVLDNVALGLKFKGVPRKEREEKAREIIKKVGLAGHEEKYAQYPTLSGGQLQRVAIARSLMVNPQILLMDEPFGALDINTRLRMQNMLKDIWAEIHPTIVFVTHDISEAVYLADEIFIMKSTPSKIIHRLQVDLPLVRNRSVKRDSRFIEMVHDIEDKMINLHKEAAIRYR
ncbi:MAG: ABC transporter ATP-binding protein [Chitinophagales bacterium]